MVGLVVGLWLAGKYYRDLASVLAFIPQQTIARVAGFLLILFAVFLIAAVLSKIIKSIIHAILLGWVDHLGGAVFGFVVGAYFLGGVLAFIVRFSLFGLGEMVKSSPLAQWVLGLPFISRLPSGPPAPPTMF